MKLHLFFRSFLLWFSAFLLTQTAAIANTKPLALKGRCESYLRDQIPIAFSVEKYEETLKNPILSTLALHDSYKWNPVQALLKRRLTRAQKIAMVAVYDSAIGQLGPHGKSAAGEYFDESRFTKAQLQTKTALLEAAGFSNSEIRQILKRPLLLGPKMLQNDKIRLAIRRLRHRYAEGLAKLTQAFKNDAHLKQLPQWRGRGELPYRDALERIHVLFSKNKTTELYEHMQALEFEVMVRTVEKNQSAEKSFEEVLTRWEDAHSFAPTREIEPRVYSASEWRQVMRSGALPQDPGLRDPFNLGGGYDNLEFALHGYDTHRVQWNVIMRDMLKNPQYYTSLEGPHGIPAMASTLFKFLGREDLPRKLEWKNTGYKGYVGGRGEAPFPGSRTLWDGLFEGDGYQHDFHNPLFIRTLINGERYRIWPSLYNVFQ